MTNKKLLEKLKEDMEMRGFSHHTKDSYLRRAKEIVEYFGKPMKQVTTKELREFLIKYLKEERKINERSVNYYNSVINSALRKVTRGKGSFPSENSVYKVLYLRLKELKEKWNKPIQNWKTIQPQLIELFGERYTKYLEL